MFCDKLMIAISVSLRVFFVYRRNAALFAIVMCLKVMPMGSHTLHGAQIVSSSLPADQTNVLNFGFGTLRLVK